MARAAERNNTGFVFFHLAARLTPPPGPVRAAAGDTASASMRNARRMADALDEARRAA